MIVRTCWRCCSNPSHRLQLHPNPLPPVPQKPRRRAKRLAVAVTLGLTLIAGSLAQEIEYRSLPQMLASGTEALQQGDFPRAASNLYAFVDTAQHEDFWQDSSIPQKVLPLAGFALYKTGQSERAQHVLSMLLSEHEQGMDRDSLAFSQYLQAISLSRNGETERATQAFADLVTSANTSALRDLALLHQALLEEDAHVSSQILTRLLAAPNSQKIANYARLLLAQNSLILELPEKAYRQLVLSLESSLPELLLLRSALAAQTGEALMRSQPALALQCFQIVSTKERLISRQEEAITALREKLKQNAPRLDTEQSIWTDHYRNLLQQMEARLDELKNQSDPYPAIQLRKALCFQRLDRFHEAWNLVEPIALGSSELTEAALQQWLDLAQAMKAWRAAALIGQHFLQLYPESDYAPKTLYQIGLSLIELEDHQAALLSFAEISRSSAQEDLKRAARYYQGICHFYLNRYPSAIREFREVTKTGNNKPIAGQAQLWLGICHFSNSDFNEALAAYQTLQNDPAQTPLHPEASYREAACRFALGEIDVTISTLKNWLETYENHRRQAEACLLLADAFHFRGELDSAIYALQKAVSENPDTLYQIAITTASLHLENAQAGRCLEALKNHSLNFRIHPANAATFFTLQANALRELGREEEAIRLIDTSIANFGNELEAEPFQILLDWRERGVEDLETHMKQAKLEGTNTLAARWGVSLHSKLIASGKASDAESLALRFVSSFSIEELPAEACLLAAEALLAIKSQDSELYFEQAMTLSKSDEVTDRAYFGLAKVALQQDDSQRSLALLEQIDYPSAEATLLKAEVLRQLGEPEKAQGLYATLLQERSGKPSHKAKALMGLGALAEEPRNAFNYYQRAITLYRGEREAVSHCYLKCIQILEQLDRFEDAQALRKEFLQQDDLSQFAAYRETEALEGKGLGL